MRTLLSVLASVVGLLLCGALGVAAGLAARNALGLDGLPGALVTLFVAMVIATIAWALGTAMLRRMHLIR
jgi:hypothetical protein